MRGFRSPTEGMRAAKKVAIDGYIFDSKDEAARYRELKLLLESGEILTLEVHPRYKFIINDHRIGSYTADFRYRTSPRVAQHPDLRAIGGEVVEDVKSGGSRLARDYRLRLRLMKALHDIDVVEIDMHPKRRRT